jgi:hypothetical protein
MILARLAYLTSPAPNIFILNLQLDDIDYKIEISKAHLANILIAGAALAYPESVNRRVPETTIKTGNAEHVRSSIGT